MLTIYRASAGAGKTHTLTGEYLRLLFKHPAAYRHILAVTFTNKATDEMKSRIIQELFYLSSGRESDYITLLSSAHKLEEEQIRRIAKQLLIAILHDYASFNISTIDRFFQQTMRAFTREIGLQGGYMLEMDQELVLSEAVDNLLAGLEKPESKDLLNWLLRFAEDKIENGGEWSLRRDIMALSREVFKESFKAFSDAINKDLEDKQSLESYKNDLLTLIRSVEGEIKKLGEKGVSILNQYGLKPEDFKGGSRSPFFYFDKLASGEVKEPTATFRGLTDNVDGCYSKTTPAPLVSIISCAFQDGLNDCIKGIIALFSNMTAYYTAKEIIRYYYTLGILADVSRQIAAYREEKNILLIADTTELLNKIIDGSDTPFIYEKIGTTIDHYMIDEFQDTSAMQWLNFRPLIKDSMDQYQDNLIVGDVKQSIYRFRNSDWKLLDEQVPSEFLPELIREETLKDNWRSFRNIVQFNNALFTVAPAILQSIYNDTLTSSSLSGEEQLAFITRIMTAYKECHQQIPASFRSKEGHVKVDFLSPEESDWKEEAMLKLPVTLQQLQDNGYALKDIAILVRTNLEGALVADTLLEYKKDNPSVRYKYDIISDDALFVSSSATVRFMVTLLRYLKNPEEKTYEQMGSYSFAVLSGSLNEARRTKRFPRYIKERLQELSRQSLYEITEGIYRLFRDYLPGDEQVFIQAFLDMVSEYAQKETADLNRFLKWWDETGHRKTISTPDSQNAIRIMTVHKSKGLGFKVVILPFGDWEIDHKPTKPVILWCRPDCNPFNRIQMVPVKYNQALSKTIFAKDYFQERLHAYIDNLNTLYVACTRAKEELVIFSPRPKKIKEKTGEVEKIGCIADLLWASLTTNDEEKCKDDCFISLPSYFDKETGSFETGNWCHCAIPEKKPAGTQEIAMCSITSISPAERLQLRLRGKGFCIDDPYRKQGMLIHDILSQIKVREDIPATIEQYELAGVITKQEANLLEEKLENLLERPEVNGWFDGTGHVLNEVEILSGKGFIRRPDRIMIKDKEVTVVDYKFGEEKEKKHYGHLVNHLKLIRQIGYTNVKGYLWYVELNEIESVNS